jgi:chromosome partitioning protein
MGKETMKNIIAVSNEKGGVAKTTTTLSLGAALAEMGQHVLLVDLDAQANLTLALGFEPGETDRTSSNILIEAAPLMSACRATDVELLDLIPSNSRIETAEQFLPCGQTTLPSCAVSRQDPLTTLRLRAMDCPPALGAITPNALSAADLLLIPLRQNTFQLMPCVT